MTDLTPVGLSKDGKTLVLVSARGTEFHVKVDQRLRTALQGDNARLGQLEITMESTLRPRDIQTRIRAGASAEEVAEAAQTSVDRIMTYAGPVLAERAHVAETAQASSVRRRSAESTATGRTLADAALVHLREVGVRGDDVTWDAWRREDGRWTLVADYVARDQERHAEFTYDMPGRYVTADNDEARLLTGEMRLVEEAPTPGARRLAAVPSQDELPLGDDALEMVRGRTEEVADLTADHADADWISDTSHEAVDGAARAEEPTASAADSDADHVDHEDTVEVERRRGRRKRSSVPSWDEIMFGGGHSE